MLFLEDILELFQSKRPNISHLLSKILWGTTQKTLSCYYLFIYLLVLAKKSETL